MIAINGRTSNHPIDPLFLERWSPRAFAPDEISTAQLLTFLEAARWAPSSYNSQPWRFVFARRDTVHWPRLLGLLNEFNESWAKSAAALVIVFSKLDMLVPGAREEAPAYHHSFDAGAAWLSIALQATRSGWHAHAMAAFDKERALVELGAPPGFRAEVAIAVGKAGRKEDLPPALEAREVPSQREPLASIAFEGVFRA